MQQKANVCPTFSVSASCWGKQACRRPFVPFGCCGLVDAQHSTAQHSGAVLRSVTTSNAWAWAWAMGMGMGMGPSARCLSVCLSVVQCVSTAGYLRSAVTSRQLFSLLAVGRLSVTVSRPMAMLYGTAWQWVACVLQTGCMVCSVSCILQVVFGCDLVSRVLTACCMYHAASCVLHVDLGCCMLRNA